MHALQLAFTSNQVPASQALATALGGQAYCDARESAQGLPFRALVTAVTDDLPLSGPLAPLGAYVVCRRVIKPGVPRVVGLFPLIHHPDRTHSECDAHWRDVHAPLALEHHAHMSYYAQLSVVHCIHGPAIDGFALCGFDSVDDLRNQFFTTPESVGVIQNDVARFADTGRSPRRLIAEVQGHPPPA